MPFLLAEILNFQGSTHHIGVGSFSNFIIESDVFTEKELEMVFYQNAVEAYYLG